MNEDNYEKIPCPKCGELMKANARYCMKCGTINVAFETNKGLKKNVQKSIDNYRAGIEDNTGPVAYATNTGNKKFAFLITYLLYIVIVILIGLSAYSSGITDLDILIMSSYPLILIMVSIAFLYIYSIELIFMKCNKPWWGGLIPFYNLLVLGEIAFHNSYIGLISFVPGIGQIFMLIMLYKLGEKFGYNGFLTMILSIIFVPIIGFSDHLYEGKAYVSLQDSKSLEKDYRYKKIFFGTLLIFLIGGLVLFIMGNMGKIRKANEQLNSSYYVMVSNKTLEALKKSIANDEINCGEQIFDPEHGIYYIRYADVGENVKLPLYLTRDPIEVYVKVDNNKNPREFSISMTDGKFGFKETLEKDVTKEIVTDYTSLADLSGNTICEVEW